MVFADTPWRVRAAAEIIDSAKHRQFHLHTGQPSLNMSGLLRTFAPQIYGMAAPSISKPAPLIQLSILARGDFPGKSSSTL
jgi:hypothetical protein